MKGRLQITQSSPLRRSVCSYVETVLKTCSAIAWQMQLLPELWTENVTLQALGYRDILTLAVAAIDAHYHLVGSLFRIVFLSQSLQCSNHRFPTL
jgi:hypothetical protein